MCQDLWSIDRVRLEVSRIKSEMLQHPPPPGARMRFVEEALRSMPESWQGFALEMLNLGYSFGVDVDAKIRERAENDRFWSLIGLALMVCGIVFVFVKATMTPDQAVLCSLLVAIGAAALLVNLPGFLELQGAIKPNEFLHSIKFKGTGAVAIFLLTFLLVRAAIKVAH